MLASLPRYMYTIDEDTVYCSQFASAETRLTIGGRKARLIQKTHYPADGKIEFQYYGEPMTLYVRIPGWCTEYKGETENGFVRFRLTNGESAVVDLPMKLHFIEANPNAQDSSGRFAVMRGPLVYCMEGIDNGENLRDITLLESGRIEIREEEGLPAPVIYIDAERREKTAELYRLKSSSRIKFTDADRCDQRQGNEHVGFDVKLRNQSDDRFQNNRKPAENNREPCRVKRKWLQRKDAKQQSKAGNSKQDGILFDPAKIQQPFDFFHKVFHLTPSFHADNLYGQIIHIRV